MASARYSSRGSHQPPETMAVPVPVPVVAVAVAVVAAAVVAVVAMCAYVCMAGGWVLMRCR